MISHRQSRTLSRVLLGGAIGVASLFIGTVAGIPNSTPAFADTVVDGCTIVSSPTPTDFTDCPGANLSSANLSGDDLQYASLSGATFAYCTDTAQCSATDFENADLGDANVSGAVFDAFGEYERQPYLAIADLMGATLTGADASSATLGFLGVGSSSLSGTNLTDANFSNAMMSPDSLVGQDLTDTNFTGANMNSDDFSGANLVDANFTTADVAFADFTGTVLIPSDQTVDATSQSGAVVSWPTPSGVTGLTPGGCTPASGSTFAIGTTDVTCSVVDDQDDPGASGTFTVDVVPQSPLEVTTSSLPVATVGVPYSGQLSATGGYPPYTWKRVSGSLPRGLHLDKTTGNISGTPSKSSTSSTFTVEVLDTKSSTKPRVRETAEATITITVSP
jgi:uncharacterized protein YjbI with pentapeptide repeats